ncbi:MAG: EAL domain-containing protein [Candidatus Marinarcus sp.]|uniref:EAL domain-containing protein n=1 Tax=Candidatus Marinarcus sp. TaxID=3100987 RepID=UPI003B008275
MTKTTTYKKLIIKSISITLVIMLGFALIYANILKEAALERLVKVDAKKTTKFVFQALYSSMSKGWTKSDLASIIEELNGIDEHMVINIYRSEEVSKQFGEIQKDLQIRNQNPFVHKALTNEESFNLIGDSTIKYYYPVVAQDECLKCHTQTEAGKVLGVIDISYPITDLQVSLASIINFFILFVITFSIVIFIALFVRLDKYLIQPIKKFINSVNQISSNKDITQRVMIEHDIQEIHSMQKVFNNMLDSLEYQFYNDELTALPNRKRLLEQINDKENAVLMILNIDKFQEINDLYGEDVGDEILQNTADLLKNNIPINAILYKLHADEYAIYYKADLDYEEINSFAVQLNDLIANHIYRANNSEIFINATLGIAFGTNYLLNNADIAMKIAKKKKKKYLVYESAMNIEHEYEQNLKWSHKIKEAIYKNQIEPLFQPIVNTQTKEIVKYEALMRIKDDNGDYISPIHFLDLAKKNKLYPELTRIMLDKTFDKFKDLPYQVSINITVQDILNEMVHKTILAKLKEYQLGDQVVFEIIESEGIENFEEVLEFINQVKSYGAKISIDDFGTGYSNFEYLMKLKVDYIKIDASMIKDIDTNKNSQLVTQTILEFARKMQIETIAEYIHSQNVYDMVKKIGIDYAQGYYFGEPQEL